MYGQAADMKSLLWLLMARRRTGTQMRRMLEETADAGRENGGLLSELHALAQSDVRNLAEVSRTTIPVWITVT